MSKTVNKVGKKRDVFIGLSFAFALGALFGFYFVPAGKFYLNFFVLVAGIICAIVFFSSSLLGRRFFAFCGEAYREMQKVVWPSGRETWQATLVVFFFVFAVAVFLWVVDKIVEWGIFSLIFGWE